MCRQHSDKGSHRNLLTYPMMNFVYQEQSLREVLENPSVPLKTTPKNHKRNLPLAWREVIPGHANLQQVHFAGKESSWGMQGVEWQH